MIWPDSLPHLGPEALGAAVAALLVLVVGFGLAQLLALVLGRVLEGRVSQQVAMIVGRGAVWAVRGAALFGALRALGFDPSVLLGAAGILTVAVGFASQTSASNLISGLFLLGERPFVVGDVISVDAVTGEVVSVDLLSVKLRTFDNLLVRVPNESLLKSNIRNLTHFPLRRFDLGLQLPYDTDLAAVRRLLVEVADAHPLCLDEPRPLILFQQFAESGVVLQFSVWAARESYLEVRNTVPERVLAAFRAAGLRFGLPQRVVHRPDQ